MVSTTDKTEKLGITLPNQYYKRWIMCAVMLHEALLFAGQLKGILPKEVGLKVVIDSTTTVAGLPPLLTAVGFGGIIGYLIGLAIRFIIKIIAVIAGLFLIALMYLQSQGILNVNWTNYKQHPNLFCQLLRII